MALNDGFFKDELDLFTAWYDLKLLKIILVILRV
jgi:hypothetical protein